MKLKDLRTGMIVTCRNGSEFTVIRDRVIDEACTCDVFVRHDDNGLGWMRFDQYNEDLTFGQFAISPMDWDIVKIERAKHPFGFMNLDYYPEKRVFIWQRKDVVKLTLAEIEERLGHPVEIVEE